MFLASLVAPEGRFFRFL